MIRKNWKKRTYNRITEGMGRWHRRDIIEKDFAYMLVGIETFMARKFNVREKNTRILLIIIAFTKPRISNRLRIRYIQIEWDNGIKKSFMLVMSMFSIMTAIISIAEIQTLLSNFSENILIVSWLSRALKQAAISAMVIRIGCSIL